MTKITIEVENPLDAYELLKSLAKYNSITWNGDRRIADLKVDPDKLKATITQTRNNYPNIKL